MIQSLTVCYQGAAKDGKTPDGSSYVDAAEKADIKALLQNQWTSDILKETKQ